MSPTHNVARGQHVRADLRELCRGALALKHAIEAVAGAPCTTHASMGGFVVGALGREVVVSCVVAPLPPQVCYEEPREPHDL